MKNEKIKEFLTRLAQEEGFKDEFLELKEKVEKKGFSNKDNEKFISECLLPWSKKLGYKLSKKDFIDFDRTQKPTEITGLSPVELENVSGGGFTMLLALFATFGSALAGFAGGGGTTGNNAKTNNNFDSTDLTFSYSSPVTSNSSLDFSSYGSSDVNNKYLNSSSVVSSGSSYALTDDQDYLSSSQWTEGTKNTSEADFNNPFAGHEPIFEQDALLHSAPSADLGMESAAERQMSTALVTMPGQPQTSVDDYNKHFARYSAPESAGPEVSAISAHHAQPTPAGDALAEDPILLSNNKIALSKGLDILGDEINLVASERQGGLRNKLNTIKNTINDAKNIDVLEALESEMDALKNAIYLASGNGVHTEALSDSLSVPGERSAALAGNVVQYGENIGASSSSPLGAPEGVNVSTTSSTLGGQETINMLKYIHAAENANFKAFGTQAEQSGGSGQVSTYTGLDSSGNAFSAAPASVGGEQTTATSGAQQAQPTPAGAAFSPINLSTWKDLPEQSGSTGGAQAQPGAQGNTGPIKAIGGGVFPALKPYLRLLPHLGDALRLGINKLSDVIHGYAEDYMNNYGETSVEEYDRHHGETSEKDYDQNYARTSPGDYDQNYARSSPRPSVFPQPRLAGNVGAGASVDASSPISLGAPEGFTVAQPSSGTQQTRLAGDVGTGSADASAPISLDVPEGVNVSTTSSTLGGQETINMLKDIHAAESANFKATETQTNQDSAGKSISTALVTTPGQPQPSVDDYNKRFARFSAAVDSGENVVQMLKDIHVEANDGSTAGYPLSTAPETTPVQHEILQQTESAGSTIELLGLEGDNSTSSGPVSGVTSGGIRWHLNTKGETVFDRDISSAQTTTTTTTGGSNSGPGTTTTSASTPSSTGSPSVGLLGYSQSSAGSGSVGSEQTQTAVATQDLNITTGFAGGGTPAEAPLPGQINTTQGNSTFSATQNNTTSNTTSESFTSGSSQNGQSWKDFVKGTAQMTGIAAGLGAAALGTVYTAASVASALSGDGAQQNASKTKETTAKTEDKKSTREAKKEESDFMRLFMENLQKNSPEAFQYLESLKSKEK